jgi:serine phosphatase RsbU (regulator of sigma subunit)
MLSEEARVHMLENEVARLKSAVAELTVLNELAIAASSSMEVEQVLDIIVEKSIKAVKAEQGSILLVTEQRDNPFQTLIRQADQRSRLLTYKIGTHITGWVLKHQTPLLIENLATDERFNTSPEERASIRSLLAVPIQFKGKILGLLTVTNKKTDEPFSRDDLRLLSILASQSGQLIRNSQLQQEALEKERLAQELAMARQIQMSLIPQKEPRLDNIEIASFFHPADEVGGDYYEYFPLNQQKIGIVQADVSGHGASAAMIMTMLKGILHSITHDFEEVGLALREINTILQRTIPADIFVTMLFLAVDPVNRIIQIANAGHNPPIFFQSKSNSSQLLELPGCALNCLPDFEYQTRKLRLSAGDSLLIYTDGYPDALNDQGQMLGYKKMQTVLEDRHQNRAPEIMNYLRDSLSAFTGNSKLPDDVALILLKVK